VNTPAALRCLAALSHENRLAIFRLLVQQGPDGMAAGVIAQRIGLPAATTSFRLKELLNAGVAAALPQGRFIYYRANYEAMNGLVAYLTENCCRASSCDAQCLPKAAKPASRRSVA
jgi:DNA-binding transcriptional ArsR family regulator